MVVVLVVVGVAVDVGVELGVAVAVGVGVGVAIKAITPLQLAVATPSRTRLTSKTVLKFFGQPTMFIPLQSPIDSEFRLDGNRHRSTGKWSVRTMEQAGLACSTSNLT